MPSQKIKDFAKTISFTVTEDSAFGIIEGFLVSVYETGNKKSFYIYYKLDESKNHLSDTPVSIMTISGALQKCFSEFSVQDYSVTENGVEVNASLSFKDFYSLMVNVAKVLGKVQQISKTVCCECGEIIATQDKHFRICSNGKNKYLCADCTEDKNVSESEADEDETDDYQEEIETVKNPTLKGILGSLLLSLGVGICLVLLYAFVIPLPDYESAFKSGYYVNWICAFSAVASIFGYKIFSKNTIGNKEIILSGVVSLVVTFVAQYVSSVILFARECIFTFENLTAEQFSKMMPYLLKIPFTDKYSSPDFKIYLLMDAIFIIVALLVFTFFTTPKSKEETVVEEIK